MNLFIEISLLALLVAMAAAIMRLNRLFAVVVLFDIYSLLSAALFVSLGAVDVAFTEASVGAGITTILMLGALSLTARRQRQVSWRRHLPAMAVTLAVGALLLFGLSELPPFGDPGAPAFGHLYARYVFESPREVGIPNMVTSILASYRGYDTLGETTVIFAAAVTVAGLMGGGRDAGNTSVDGMQHHLILRTNARLLMPLILLFALYVQFHGDYGPGGGFQAGVIFAGGLILYGLVFGFDSVRGVVPPKLVRILCASGLTLYILVGFFGMMLGGNFLDYGVLTRDPLHGQHLGIALIELGVGTTVAAAMIGLFYAFAGYQPGPARQ
jgi:multicomponent Na+:H+ antiporter subunit B